MHEGEKLMPLGKWQKSPVSLLESCKTMKQALQIHARITLSGLHHQNFSLSRLFSFFALFGGSQQSLHHARLLFSQIDHPNVFFWNTMIRGYSRSEYPHESLDLFKFMFAANVVIPNNFTYPFLLNSCAKLSNIRPGLAVHSHITKMGFASDLFIVNSLIHLYSSFGFLDNAHLVFDESPIKDRVSFNTMVNAYAQCGWPINALNLFREMQGLGIEPDEFTLVAILSACSTLNDLKTGKQIHLLLCKNYSFDRSNNLLINALIDMYAKCGSVEVADRLFTAMGTGKNMTAWSSMISGYVKCGQLEKARSLFDQMSERDLVSWTAMISGYSQMGKYMEALDVFVEMENHGLKPDEVTVVAALSACARLGALDFGKRLHDQYVKSELLGQNPVLTTAIVDMYVKCGSIETAVHIFQKVKPKLKYTFLYNSIICGLAQYGLGEAVISVFRDMESTGLRPDSVTFVGALCACSHGGLVEEGKRIFASMSKVHGLEPQSEHYCCMVDLLGRRGLLKEANEFIQKMPFEADAVIWRSLLSACRTYGNVEIAEVAAEKLLKLDPSHGARFVLLSNIFTDANRWEDARRTRKFMEDSGVVKPPGWSYIELNGVMHRFMASDKYHPQAKEIKLFLDNLAGRLKSTGHVQEKNHVFFRVEEEGR